MMPEAIAIELIRTDGGTQIRTETNITQAQSYLDDMAAGDVFPPIVVFFDGVDYWLADGFHRLIAAEELGLTEFSADVREGTRRDAILYAVGANAAHGLKRTNKCKRNAVMTLLKDPEWSAWSDNKISDLCAVTQPFVSKLRASLITVISEPQQRTYTTKHGTTATMQTGNIGGKPKGPTEYERQREAWAREFTAGTEFDEDDPYQPHQIDIEDIAPTPQRAPRYTPAQRSEAAHIRYFLGEIDRRLGLPPVTAAAAFNGEIRGDAEQVARVVSWLIKFQGELNAEMSRREEPAAAD
jgi:hypothetical protein